MARTTKSDPSGETPNAPHGAEFAGPLPPPTVPADVNVKFRTGVNPNAYLQGNEYERRDIADELHKLALDEDENLTPPSIFAQFCEQFSEHAGLASVNVVRLPDPADKRMPGSQFARVNFGEIEQLGTFMFDPASLLASLQMVNGNSGGVFRLWLTDQYGQMIPGARLDRLAVVDPLGARTLGQPPTPQPAPQPVRIEAPASRELTDDEKQIKELQRSIMQNALNRLMNPPEPQPVSPASALPPQDQLALLLLSNTDILGEAIHKISAVVHAGEGNAAASTWQDKLTDLVTQNPQLVERVGGVVDRIVARIFGPDSRYDQAQYIPPPPQQAPQQHPYQRPPQPQYASPGDNLPPDAPNDEQDNEDMALLDELIAYLSSNDAIEKTHPVFRQLRTQYPVRFRFYVQTIAAAPNAGPIIEFLKQAGPLYKALLEGPLQAHYETRIEQLRQLCVEAVSNKATSAPDQPPTPAQPTE